MLKVFTRYVREHLGRDVISQKEKVDSATKKQQSCYCAYNSSFFPDSLKKIKRFARCKRAVVSVREQKEHTGTNGTFTTSDYLKDSWIEALGWSGTLAFGWAVSQNFHRIRRRKTAEDFLKYYQIEPYHIPRRSLCPHYILKSILVHNVLAQPNDLIVVKSFVPPNKAHTSPAELPVFGPKTAEETLNEVGNRLKKPRNEAIGELENRLGLRCMSKHRYRKAIIHFAAGSALQNSSAVFNLAQCYELGLGTSKDFVKAAKCYRTASDLGNASATYNLAVFYAHGYGGLKSDRSKALQLLEKAVQLGDANAEELLQKFMIKTSKPAFGGSEKAELNSTVESNPAEDSRRAASTIKKPSIAVLKLPFSKIKNDPVTSSERDSHSSTECCSASTDDGLASEYDSSVSSVDSRPGSSCQTSDLSRSPRCEKYGSPLNTDDVNSGILNLRMIGVPEKLKKHMSSVDNSYPISALMEIYKLVTVPGH